MREVLFRGQHRRYGEKVDMAGNKLPSIWAYGGVLQGPGERSLIYGALILGSEFEGKYPVCTKTLGQYTGLTDKNGVKIFEGDILDCGDRVVYVRWHEQCGTWDSQFIRCQNELCSNGITNVEWKYRAVVIGNIHDNPELLAHA